MQSQDIRFRLPRDVWIGVLFLILTALYWRSASTIPISPLDGVVNAAAMPHALAVAMAAFCCILILRALAVEWLFVRAARVAAQSGSGAVASRPDTGEKDGTLRDHLRAAGMLAIGIVYLLILPYLGYILSMTALVLSASVFIGARAGLYTLAVAVGTAVVFYLLFVLLLDIPMPAGVWPSLFS